MAKDERQAITVALAELLEEMAYADALDVQRTLTEVGSPERRQIDGVASESHGKIGAKIYHVARLLAGRGEPTLPGTIADKLLTAIEHGHGKAYAVVAELRPTP